MELSKKWGTMKELMLELLTYEPFGKFLSAEKTYIQDILCENYQPPPSEVHDLFSGFYNYVQRGDSKDIDWFRIWRNTYHQKQKNKDSTTSIRSPKPFPLLFREICFYIIVRGNFSDKEFREILGTAPNFAKKWGISTKFRRYAEANTYSAIKSFRPGVKREYIVSIVKKLYYEVGRKIQEEQEGREAKKCESMTVQKLPTFVDVFAGTGSVAASVVLEGCPPPIVNDYDPVMVCFAWAFVHRKAEFRKRIAEFHNYLMNLDFESTNWSYDANAYERHHNPENVRTSPQAWDDPKIRESHIRAYGYSEVEFVRDRRLAQQYQEFIMRTRSSYKDVGKILDLSDCDREKLRNLVNNISPHSHSIAEIEDVLDYALAIFYYYSFSGGKAGNAYYETYVDTASYTSYLNKLQLGLKFATGAEIDFKVSVLLKLQLEASSLILESTGHFSSYLNKAKFCSKDFSEILKDDPSNKIYYLDSPYFLTAGYAIGFPDDKHRQMLDLLQNAEFKWIFSMQFNSSKKYKASTSKGNSGRGDMEHVIKDYGSYYRGFYAELQLDMVQKVYISTATPEEVSPDLFAVLFDFNKVKKKWKNMSNTKTTEILVVNFNPLRTIPFHDSAVVLPFSLFLHYADRKQFANKQEHYQYIVDKAIEWREENIKGNYTSMIPI